MGGDIIAGTNFVDALKVFETDDDTEAIILVGELGGTNEEEAADWIKDYNKRVSNPKPIAACIGGFQAKPGKITGHAGAWTGLGEGTSEDKYRALEAVGVTMVDHPAKFGGVMKEILAKSGRSVKKIVSLASKENCLLLTTSQEQSAAQARRGYHTSARRPTWAASRRSPFEQKRPLHLSAEQNASILKKYDINVVSKPENQQSSHYLGISPHRVNRSPSIIAAPTANPDQLHQRVRRFPFDYREGPSPAAINDAMAWLQLDAAPPKAKAQVVATLSNLWKLYKEKEAIDAHVSLSLNPNADEIQIYNPYLFFDDAAYRSNQRQADLHALRDTLSPTEQEAEGAGIVYIPLDTPQPDGRLQASTQPPPATSSPPSGEPRNLVGTLVNGAGLAMNTNDVLHLRLSQPPYSTANANFLDTGGKATSQTIKTSFKLILSDPRVAVVFVNIFGGLTLADMIAEGIILAFKELGVEKPVVVRLRGTNEEKGQKVLQDANLPIYAINDFEEAVRKVGELANGGR
jgi:succinyl-CoA synthetase alpha subunit